MQTVSASSDELIVTAPNGVEWRRLPGKRSTAAEFLAAMETLCRDSIEREWNLWREGEPRQEDDRLTDVFLQWEHTEPPPGGYIPIAKLHAEWDARRAEDESQREARVSAYDEDRAVARLSLLRRQADAGFMRHVLENPASDAQRDKATEFLSEAEQEITMLQAQVGDPDTVQDQNGYLPAARRDWHLRSHMSLLRHELLREWSTKERKRFRELLAMPVPQPADMCPECEAPAEWHTFGVSLRLFPGKPEPGSQAEIMARHMPGCWERCPASTAIQIRQWWGCGLPDFGGDQWQAMLTPLLRAIFAPEPTPPRKKPDKRAALEKRLRSTEAEAKRIRRELSGLDPDDS